MPEFGDLSSSVNGFLFTVTNKLPNKSLPDLLFVYSFEFLSTDEAYFTRTYMELWNLSLFWTSLIVNVTIISRLDQFLQERSRLILYSRLKTFLTPTHSHFIEEGEVKYLYFISHEKK